MRDPQSLAHDRVEVDEHLAAQKIVDRVLARGVLAHQPLERGRFVGCVVVDVQVRKLRAPLVDEVDKLLEGASLAVAVVRPERPELRLPVLEPEDAEEIFETAVRLPPRVAFHVEEEVAR